MTTTSPRRSTFNDYNGPMPKEMITSHILAKDIINRHNDPCPILDNASILLHEEFVKNLGDAQAILERAKVVDEADRAPGTYARNAGP
jgi:hypothetical protein